MLSTTVFQAFPNAIEEWTIAACKYSTITGNIIPDADDWQNIHVIVDEGSNSEPNQSPNAAGISGDTLLYCQPNELPTIDTADLTANYGVADPYGKTYAIIDAGIGKNQENGQIEHVELRIRQTNYGASNGNN